MSILHIISSFYPLVLLKLKMCSLLNDGKALTGLTVVGAALLAVIVWRWRKCHRRVVPNQWSEVGTVSKLFIYPVKSCKGLEVQEGECTKLGLKAGPMRDRAFIITDDNYTYLNVRGNPHIVLITPCFHGNELWLDAPNMATIRLTLPSSVEEARGKLKEVSCRLWDIKCSREYDCGDDVALWLSRYILKQEKGARLLCHMTESSSRPLRPKYLGFQELREYDIPLYGDITPYMLMTEASLAELNDRLETPVKVLQLRPNILVAGSRAYAEDTWQFLKIGRAVFRMAKPCNRCLSTIIDPDTGVKNEKMEPLQTLKMYRQSFDPKVRCMTRESPLMGINLGIDVLGKIQVGDTVYIGTL